MDRPNRRGAGALQFVNTDRVPFAQLPPHFSQLRSVRLGTRYNFLKNQLTARLLQGIHLKIDLLPLGRDARIPYFHAICTS